MRVIKSMLIAFSMYSRIPVPQFPWKDEDMKYVMCFFPAVGLVIGTAVFGWGMLAQAFSMGNVMYALIGAALPLFLSGGIHLDGYMDTMDALHSYESRERKLEILKDPHIGAFSVIGLLLFYAVYIGAFSEIRSPRALGILAAGFWLSRIGSAFAVVSLPCAKREGTVFLFSGKAQEKTVKAVLLLELFFCLVLLTVLGGAAGLLPAAGAFVTYCYSSMKCKKEFGGITGDTAGWFLTLCEGVMAVLTALLCLFHRL